MYDKLILQVFAVWKQMLDFIGKRNFFCSCFHKVSSVQLVENVWDAIEGLYILDRYTIA